MTISFQPWVGDRFREGLGGTRLLIVGESHHGPSNQNDELGFTIRCIESVVSGIWKLKFFANLQSIFAESGFGIDSPTTPETRAEFWARVSFYNYVQEMIAAPGLAPTPAAWESGRQPFAEVLNDLRPTCVLFACKRLYFTATDRFETAAPLSVAGSSRHVAWVPYENGRGTASFILHPSYRGYRKQRPWVTALIGRASTAPLSELAASSQ